MYDDDELYKMTEDAARTLSRIILMAFIDVACERLTSTQRIAILCETRTRFTDLASSWDTDALFATLYAEEIALIDEYLEGMG